MIPGSANPLLLASAAEAEPSQIERSLRFNSADSAYLSRTPASAGNRKTWTWAGWVKRSAPALSTIFGVDNGGGTSAGLVFSLTTANSEKIEFFQGGTTYRISTQIFRDFSAWYHIVLALDTTAVTANNRIKLYVNGSEVTAFDTLNNPTQDADLPFNSTVTHSIGSDYTNAAPRWHFNGYLADIHFIDGQALDPTSFGNFDSNGVWQPIEYTGTYGTNGFHLDFADNSSAAALGYDAAGSNDWTVNNISVAAGAGNDSLVDTPTNYGTDTGVGGEVRGNYATYNRLNSAGTLANGNLESTPGADLNNGYAGVSSIAIPLSGKWYAEFTLSAITSGSGFLGIIPASANGTLSNRFSIAGSYGYISINGNKRIADVDSAYGASYAASDVIGVAVDMDNLQLTFYKNNSSQGAISVSSASYVFCSSGGANSSGVTWVANFGQRPFAYTAPSGFKALCTANLDDPQTITTSGSYTGNGVADGPFVYLNGVPTAMTVNGNAVTFGTHADKLSNGFKIRTTSTTYNQNASTYNYSITSTGDPFKIARAQSNP